MVGVGVPFLTHYLKRIVRVQAVSDSVDRLNYYVTSYLLAFLAFAISCKQYFGSPIQCWTPKEFGGSWDKYTENYCFIANAYHVPMDEEIPQDNEFRQDQISYYRWVPIMLALQAVMFYLPNHLWCALQEHTAINPSHFVKEAERVKALKGKARDTEVDTLANYFLESVAVFRRPRNVIHNTDARSGRNAVYLYLMVKLLYVLNIVAQIWLVERFLGGKFIAWGFNSFQDILAAPAFDDSSVFPRVIYCDFQVRRLGQLHRHTVQCVIMMNMINEKVYMFLCLWFMFLFVCTAVNCFYYIFMLLTPALRHRMLLIAGDGDHNDKGLSKYRMRFVSECAMPDGVLLLQFVREHVGGRVAFELTSRILATYTSGCMGSFKAYSDESIANEKEPLSSEKSTPPRFFSNVNEMANAPPLSYENANTLPLRTKNAPAVSPTDL